MFNLATGSRITLNNAIAKLRELTGYSGEVKHGPERAGDIKHSKAEIQLAKQQLGYTPQIDFQEGFKRTIHWYRSP